MTTIHHARGAPRTKTRPDWRQSDQVPAASTRPVSGNAFHTRMCSVPRLPRVYARFHNSARPSINQKSIKKSIEKTYTVVDLSGPFQQRCPWSKCHCEYPFVQDWNLLQCIVSAKVREDKRYYVPKRCRA